MFKFVHIVETELVAAAAIKFDEILVQILLSKNHVLLKGAALIKVRLLIPFVRYMIFFHFWGFEKGKNVMFFFRKVEIESLLF